MAKKTLAAILADLPQKQSRFLDRLTPAQNKDLDELATLHHAGKLNVSWDLLAEGLRVHWGMATLSRNTLKHSIERLCNAKKKS